MADRAGWAYGRLCRIVKGGVGLYENGYVRFKGVMDVCVQIPEEDFKLLTDLLDSHIGTAPGY